MTQIVKFKVYPYKYVRSFSLSINFRTVEKSISKYQTFDEIPGPKSYPAVGTLYKYLPFIGEYKAESMHKTALLNYQRYGDIVREEPAVRLVHLYDPDLIEALFRQDDRHPSRRSHVAMLHYRLSKPSVYNTGGLLSTNGPDWWRLRRTFQKNFTSPQSVKEHVETTDIIVQDFVKWTKAEESRIQGDFLPFLSKLNLEVIGAVAFNEIFNSFSTLELDPNSRSSKIIDAAFGSNSGIMKLDKGIMWRFFNTPLYRKLMRSQEYLEKISDDILLRKINFFKEGKTALNDTSLVDSFLKSENVDLKDVRGMMVDILMAAIDTTAYATSFVLYHMANNYECQQKAFTEIFELLPHKETKVTAEVISKAIYVRSCVKESLRLNPVSIGVGRLLQKDIVLKGYHIPKGTVVVAQNMISSILPQYLKNPFEFKPERWMRGFEDHEYIHPFLSLPFGFGPRSCIARRLAEQNMTITLIRLIREFEMKWTSAPLGIVTHLINKPDKPLLLNFKSRSV